MRGAWLRRCGLMAFAACTLATSASVASAQTADRPQVIAAADGPGQQLDSSPPANIDSGSPAHPDEIEPQMTPMWIAAQLVWMGVGVIALGLAARFGLLRLPREPLRPKRFEPVVGLMFFITIFLAGYVAGSIALATIGVSEADEPLPFRDSTILIGAAMVGRGLLVVVFALAVARAITSTSTDLPQRPSRASSAARAVPTLLCVWALAMLAGLIARQVQALFDATPTDPVAHETLRAILGSTGDDEAVWRVVQMVLVVIAAPIIEEVMYRGIIQESLRRIGAAGWTAIVLASGLFAMAHFEAAEPHAIVSLFVLSLGFGWLYERTGRLTGPIVMHALFNAGNIGLAMLLPA